jgi:hypothetical protein
MFLTHGQLLKELLSHILFLYRKLGHPPSSDPVVPITIRAIN